MKTVLVTGAGGGFGLLITKQLISDGYKVIGTLRDINGRNKNKSLELQKLGAKTIEMDVTSDASTEKAFQEAGLIDVLINNAGVGVLGLTETFTTEDLKKVFDVNVFGIHRTMRAALPKMRHQKNSLVINISSLLGRITIPFYGPYNATKWAVEGLTENYRTEVSQLGIDVCIVEPGGYPTSFIDNLVRPSDASRAKDYGPMGEMAEPFLENFEKALAANPAQDPKNVALSISKLIATSAGARPFRTIVDNLGMGIPVAEYNSMSAKMTEAIYGNFGIAHLLKLKN